MTFQNKKINNVAIIGMGALGMMYGDLIGQSAWPGQVHFIMDSGRYQASKDQIFTVNGQLQSFTMVDAAVARPADLLIVATKYSGLHTALDLMENLIDDETIILSVLNGISSEQIIAERFGWQPVLGCVAIGMDTMRSGHAVHYTKKGRLQIGVFSEQQRPLLIAVKNFFDAVGLPCTVEEDIRHALWAKFLLNVGINQACMVYETTYSGVLHSEEIFRSMTDAMYEVILIAGKEGVRLTEQDIEKSVAILRTLKPDSYPSMRQDALARRPSEVELFAGTVMQIAAKHQVPVPMNTFYYNRIKAMEAAYMI